jgi:ankyrin repeat protein
MAETGADGDALNAPQDGWTPLYTASYLGNAEVVRALLANGADVEAKADVSMTPRRMDAQPHARLYTNMHARRSQRADPTWRLSGPSIVHSLA